VTNHQSIATITAILSQIVQGFAASAVDGAGVTMQRPDSAPTAGTEGASSSRVNLFMFQASFDPTFRNADLPTRDRGGQAVQRPRAALQLHYLLSFYGEENVLAPQRMLAAVIAGLHGRPWISMEHAAAFVAANQGNNSSFHYLADSRLAEQGESVRLTPDSLNLEELSKLWSVFFQVPYALSIAYKASVVLVDAPDTPHPRLPVRIPVIDVRADHSPIVVAAVRAEGAASGAPIFASSTLAISGSGFAGKDLVVRIDGVPTPTSPASPTALLFDLSGRGLRAGSRVLQVARLAGAASNPVRFALRPRVTAVSMVDVDGVPGRAIQVDSDVTIGADQSVEVLLQQRNGERTSLTLTVPRRDADSSRVQVPRSELPNGTFLVRLRIDGVESELESSDAPSDWSYTGPALVLT
jgi:hypothetical protein